MSLSKQNVKIAIIGGGLGGVPAAITLGNLGYDVHIFEQASEYYHTLFLYLQIFIAYQNATDSSKSVLALPLPQMLLGR